MSGLGVALGPVVGGAVVEGFSWQWIFWLNVPIGLALVPAAMRMLAESRGPVWVGSAVLAIGALVALLVAGRRAQAAPVAQANDGLGREAVAA